MSKKTAREIYFDNFGNFITMKQNGEYRDYERRKVPVEIERQWSIEIKNHLIDDIVNKGELFKIVPLSRINLPENEVIEAFNTLLLQCSRIKIRQALEQLKNLISPGIFEELIRMTESTEGVSGHEPE